MNLQDSRQTIQAKSKLEAMKEIALNAYDYYLEFQESVKQRKPTHTILELMKRLIEDGSEETIWWYNDILWDVNSNFKMPVEI